LTIERNGVIEQMKVRYDFKDFNYWNSTKRVKSKSINDEIGYINMASVKRQIFQVFLIHLKLKKVS
jgi:hypothetical protein